MPSYTKTFAIPRATQYALLLVALASFHARSAVAHPCQEKQWIDTPIIARSLGLEGRGDGIGGTGRGQDEEGIGGTGRSADSEGMGGTGRSSPKSTPSSAQDLGFIGVIAGFASICVNGQEIHFNPATPIQIDGKSSDAAQLNLGQMVAVAAQSSAGEYYARSIAVFNTLVGPVEKIDPAGGSLRILGQTLLVAGNAIDLVNLTLGDRLIANGSRLPNGDILLTRLERAPQHDEVSLVGPVTQFDGDTFKIFDATIRPTPGNALPATLHSGQEVFVRGHLMAGTIQADTLVISPQLSFGDAVHRLDLQGHIRRIDGTDRMNVGGTDIRLDSAAEREPQNLKGLSEGVRVKISAKIEADGRIVAEQIRIERPASRADRLPPPDNPDRNTPRRGNERDGLDNAALPPPTMRSDLLMLPTRPDRPAREAELDRPSADMVRPEIVRPLRPMRPDRPNLPDRPTPR